MHHRSIIPTTRIQLSTVSTCTLFAIFAFSLGCQRSMPPTPTTGGDFLLTAQRLANTRLTDIREPLSWTFTSSTVLIDYKGQPIPTDVIEVLLGDGSTPLHIEASWHLDEEAKNLCLSDVKTDKAGIDKEITIPISPAGHVRVNLGSRQYNLFRDRIKSQ